MLDMYALVSQLFSFVPIRFTKRLKATTVAKTFINTIFNFRFSTNNAVKIKIPAALFGKALLKV